MEILELKTTTTNKLTWDQQRNGDDRSYKNEDRPIEITHSEQ